MGEAKRRKRLDSSFGLIPRPFFKGKLLLDRRFIESPIPKKVSSRSLAAEKSLTDRMTPPKLMK